MKKPLSKALSTIVFLAMMLPSSNTVFATGVSTAPVDTNITITNNVGISDSVNVTGLAVGDIVTVYSSTKSLGTATVTAGKTAATVTVAQLGATAGSVFVTVKSTGSLESNKIEKTYEAEAKSSTLGLSQILVTNNITGKSDTVAVTGLGVGDIVKVYSVATGGTASGTATVATGKTDATISITQLGSVVGKVYVSLTSKGKLEGDRIEVAYSAESKSVTLDLTKITVTNNALGTSDTVAVSGLSVGDIVKVYSALTGGTALGTATVATGKAEASITITQLGAKAGTVYVSVANTGKLESDRVAVTYDEEAKSQTPTNVVVTNNTTGKSDTVVVTGLLAGDIIKVYTVETSGKAIGTATVTAGKTDATVTITQLGQAAGTVYVSVTSKGKLESDRTDAIKYLAEAKSTKLDASQIAIINNAKGTSDTVGVTGLAVGDIVKIYSAVTDGTALGTATVATGKTAATVTVSQIGADAGTLYVSITNTGKLESDRSSVTFAAEAKSITPDKSKILVTNNLTGKSDTVAVAGLAVGDVVKVYAGGTDVKAIGTATVAAGKTDATITITQLGTAAGNIYVTVTSKGNLESDKTTAIAYVAEPKSSTSGITKITPYNFADVSDVITVEGLSVGDIVKVYAAETGGVAIASSKAVATGKTGITFNVAQLGATGGSVYLTVTSTGSLESDRKVVTVTAEP